MKRYFSFTLVEILVVTVLVSLLAAIGFAGYGYAMNASRRAATESLIQQISAGLENFKIKNGYYPVSNTYTVIQATFNTSDGMLETVTFGAKQYKKGAKDGGFDAFFKNLDQEKFKKNISGGQVVDSWGGAVYYKYPGAVNTAGFDLISPGEDGKFGVTPANTPAAAPTAATYKSNDEWACDDIANFMNK